MNYKQEFGNYGEEEAARYLQNINYKIIERNYSCKFGELDIIAYDCFNNEIVIVEVKSRQQMLYGSPAEAVDSNKKSHIKKATEFYACLNHLENYNFRFDVIEILSFPREKLKLNHIIQAFE